MTLFPQNLDVNGVRIDRSTAVPRRSGVVGASSSDKIGGREPGVMIWDCGLPAESIAACGGFDVSVIDPAGG